MNTFGNFLRLTTFGESHGAAIGGVIDGFPPGIKIDFEHLRERMEERRPGKRGTSSRRENDMPEILSGISGDGVTLGTPIGFIIRNHDMHSRDYDALEQWYRPNHADYTYMARYGIRDHRGGGRASARETACRVVAGALAEQYLLRKGITVEARLVQVGKVKGDLKTLMKEVERVKSEKDSVGGIVEGTVIGVPAGVGNPVYDKLGARLACGMMSINAAKGFEIGGGFGLAKELGSAVVDEFFKDENGEIKTRTNYSGGIQGGISNGMPIEFKVAFKPTPTIAKEIPLINDEGDVKVCAVEGRHDPCVAVRAVGVVRAMAALVVSDLILQSRF